MGRSIAILNYGVGNLGSIANMLRAIGETPLITADLTEIRRADRLILPGVGSFDAGMSKLKEGGLAAAVKDAAAIGKPILGICLGMQLLGRGSEEGHLAGLDLIPFDNIRFRLPENGPIKVPHMGWDVVSFKKNDSLLDDIQGTQRYYFVHSYHAVCDFPEDILMTCDYGYEFAAAVCHGNVRGVQFHPEKSHDFGMRLLENFVRKC